MEWYPRACTRAHRAVVLALAAVVVAGCSESGDASVSAARAQVTVKENALDDAREASSAADAAFCSATQGYITALDRYGDVLDETAPTVGDVRDAGADLEEPAAEAEDAGVAVVEAREGVTVAEQELADAEAALASAEAAAAGSATTPSPSTSPESPPPSTTPPAVTRVREAQDDFDAAAAGITDQTPLRQAAEQFNAAAVALEMAWLQLLGASGCLSDEQQEEATQAVREMTTALQQDLADAGYYTGEVDGVYGPETVDAVQQLQKANGLPQTGTLDKATEQALRSELAVKGGAEAQEEIASTAALQQTLTLAGYWDGPVDGEWSDELSDALGELQADLGVEVTGTVDAATVAAFEEALTEAQGAAEPSATATATPSETASQG